MTDIYFYNSNREPIITLCDMKCKERGECTFIIESCFAMYTAQIQCITELNNIKELCHTLRELYDGVRIDFSFKTSDESLKINASMNHSGIILWTFQLIEVGTMNYLKIKDSSDRTFLPDILNTLTQCIKENAV